MLFIADIATKRTFGGKAGGELSGEAAALLSVGRDTKLCLFMWFGYLRNNMQKTGAVLPLRLLH